MQADNREKKVVIALAAFLNTVLVACVILSVIFSFKGAQSASFSQNVENVKTLTNASANKIELEIFHHTQEVARNAEYISSYNDLGMTAYEVEEYFDILCNQNSSENYSWQLVEGSLNDGVGTAQGFNAVTLGNEHNYSFTYRRQSYAELSRIFTAASETKMGIITCTSEFTDPSPSLDKSFAVTAPVRIRDDSQEDGCKYQTLMLLIKSDYINYLISSNNDINTFNLFDFSNIIIDNQGNYVISNGYFQGTNILDYIGLYNQSFGEKDKQTFLDNLHTEDYSEVVYYQNNKGQDCAYTIVPVQNSDWHVLSMVPLKSFHNAYNYGFYFIIFASFFAILFIVDIVFVLMINRQLRHRTKEAQAANIAKSQFLSSMSHDIRTPMNAIIGMTVIAERNLNQGAADIDVLRDCIKTIKLSGNHLLTLINDILDISKIENGIVALSPEVFSITESVTRMVEIVQPQINEKRFHFELNMSQVRHSYVYADELRINQIYMNIMSNAIKYTNEGGSIKVTLLEDTDTGKEGVARYIYTVQDTGIGMSPEFLNNIFDRFSRAIDTRVNTTQGTGLGMSISKQLVDMMGGTIDVKSQLDKGSVFTVTLELPAAKEPDIDVTTERYKKTGAIGNISSSLRVLVVEDNNVNWKVLDKLLSLYNIHADRVDNGQKAVDCIMDNMPYDLVLMDVQMPVMNGYDATKAIRRLTDVIKASVPVYAMTADTFAEDISHCMECGMNGHLAKPVEVDKLARLLATISNPKS